jgi:hypothetical protein
MSIAANYYKKALSQPDKALVVFRAGVLDKYLEQNGTKVQRTETVGRVKTATWSLDFGIAPDEQSIHVPLGLLRDRLPENELEHWLGQIDDSSYSENFLKMQSSHSCIDDGGLRDWGGEESLF